MYMAVNFQECNYLSILNNDTKNELKIIFSPIKDKNT